LSSTQDHRVIDLTSTGTQHRINVDRWWFANVHAVRLDGTSTAGVIEFKRANTSAAPGAPYATAQTLTLNADTLFKAEIDVRDQLELVIDVTTAASGNKFDLYLYLTDE
jgi:hypothetical protein